MTRLLELDEVSDDLVNLIETFLDLVGYHDMPVWLLIEPNGTFQVDVVLDAGHQRINCYWRAS